MFEINPTNHKNVTAHFSPDEDFREFASVSEMVESKRDSKQIESEFCREYGFNKYHSRLIQVIVCIMFGAWRWMMMKPGSSKYK